MNPSLVNFAYLSSILFLASISIGMGIASAWGSHNITLTMGFYQSMSSDEIDKRFRPLADALEKGLTEKLRHKTKINIVSTGSYLDGQNSVSYGITDFMRIGPVSLLKIKTNVKIIVQEIHGERGYLVAPKDSNINKISDLIGTAIAFGAKDSTTSTIYPKALLYQEGLRSRDFRDVMYFNRHDFLEKYLSNGVFDVAASKKKSDWNVLAEYATPGNPWVASPNMPASTYGALIDAFTTINDPVVLYRAGVVGYHRADISQFDGVKRAIAQADKFDER